MKIKLLPSISSLSPGLKQFRALNESFIDLLKISDGSMPELTEESLEEGESEIVSSNGSMLCPQAHASFMGLRKLIEKDWFEGENYFLSGYRFF